MGYDTRGRLVWPDSSIHDGNPNYIVLYALPTDNFETAEMLSSQILKVLNKLPDDAWTPAAGLGRGLTKSLADYSYVEQERLVSNRVNPVMQKGENDE